MKEIAFFLLALSISACGSVTTNPKESKNLIGTCQELKKSSYLVKTSSYPKARLFSERLIVPKEFFSERYYEVLGTLSSGTEIEIVRVLKDKKITASCWLVEVRVLSGDFSGKLSEIPTCYTLHPPTWLNSDGPNGEVDELKIKPEYAVECTKPPIN